MSNVNVDGNQCNASLYSYPIMQIGSWTPIEWYFMLFECKLQTLVKKHYFAIVEDEHYIKLDQVNNANLHVVATTGKVVQRKKVPLPK